PRSPTARPGAHPAAPAAAPRAGQDPSPAGGAPREEPSPTARLPPDANHNALPANQAASTGQRPYRLPLRLPDSRWEPARRSVHSSLVRNSSMAALMRCEYGPSRSWSACSLPGTTSRVSGPWCAAAIATLVPGGKTGSSLLLTSSIGPRKAARDRIVGNPSLGDGPPLIEITPTIRRPSLGATPSATRAPRENPPSTTRRAPSASRACVARVISAAYALLSI